MMTNTWSELGKPVVAVEVSPLEPPAELPDEPVTETEVELAAPPELPA